jgi:hypothetical protein
LLDLKQRHSRNSSALCDELYLLSPNVTHLAGNIQS